MKRLLILLLLLSGCTNSHRLVLVYESGETAISGGSRVIVKTKGDDQHEKSRGK